MFIHVNNVCTVYKQKQSNKYKNYINVSLIFLFSSSVLALFNEIFSIFLKKIFKGREVQPLKFSPPNPPMESTPEAPYNMYKLSKTYDPRCLRPLKNDFVR